MAEIDAEQMAAAKRRSVCVESLELVKAGGNAGFLFTSFELSVASFESSTGPRNSKLGTVDLNIQPAYVGLDLLQNANRQSQRPASVLPRYRRRGVVLDRIEKRRDLGP